MDSFSPEVIEYLDKQIKEVEKQILSTNNFDLNYYVITEKNFYKYIKENIPLYQQRAYRKAMKYYLKERFLANRFERRKNLINKMQAQFYLFLDTFNTLEDLNEICRPTLFYSAIEPEKNDNVNISKSLKAIHIVFWERCKKFIYEDMDSNTNIPMFILSSEKKILKQKITSIWKYGFDIPFDEVKMASNPMFCYLTKQFLDFINNKVNLFDSKYYDIETKSIFFELFLKANWNYLSYENNKGFFLSNLKKYLCIIGIEKEYDKYYTIVSKDSEFGNQGFCEQLNTKLGIGYIDDKNNQSKAEPFYYLIFSFSCLLNNFVQYTEDEVEGNAITFTPQLLCSSREREFLFNLINKLDAYIYSIQKEQICMKINYILENYIFKNLIKSYTKVLFDENNKTKLRLPFARIYDLIKKVNPKHPYYTNKSNDMNEYIFNSLPESVCLSFTALFSAFISSYEHRLELPQEEDENMINKMKYSMSSVFHQINPKDTIAKINVNNIELIPHDPFSISTHICLCIYGIFYPSKSILPIKNIWSNLTKDKRNVDFYFFNWQDEGNFFQTNIAKNVFGVIGNLFSKAPNKKYEDVNSENMNQMIKNNKILSKFYGRFLAYVLASRSVFKFHTISLLGYSLGCNVIKYCLKELRKIQLQGVNTEEIIHNVVLIGGATTLKEKNKEILTSVSGNMVNCYSNYDLVLQNHYSPEAIGLNKIVFEKDIAENNNLKEYSPKIENINMTQMRLDHDDYKTEIPDLLNKITIL